MKKLFVLVLLGVLLAACSTTSEVEAPSTLLPDSEIAVERIPGQYIVVLNGSLNTQSAEDFSLQAAAVAADLGVQSTRPLQVINGFVARFDDAKLTSLRADPRVAYVEQDQIMKATRTQSNPTWGLDRIDERTLPLDRAYQYDATGSGVTAYIIDTGIRASHSEFGGRVVGGVTAIDDGRGSDDCNGHGTHVAGTVGGSRYGVAKEVSLFAVRVLGCRGDGSNSGVIAGVDWVTSNHSKPAVANMSLGGGTSRALDDAINNSIRAGVSYAVAAGNENQNACNVSPARVDAALTVGSTTTSDRRSSFSNYGSCVDIFAPGSDITSAWYTGNSSANTISGTSMASPHVAGAMALVLEDNPDASPSAVFQLPARHGNQQRAFGYRLGLTEQTALQGLEIKTRQKTMKDR